MEKDETRLSELDSLNIIRQMIDTAKHEQKDDGKGWIIWGWMLFIASVGTIANIRYGWFDLFFFWNAFGIVVLIIGVYEAITAFFIRRRIKVKTYTRAIFDKLNVGFFVSIMFIIVSMNIGVSPLRGFPLLMSLYAFWILIYGALLSFRPSMIGAMAMWILAFVALFVPEIFSSVTGDSFSLFSWTMLLHALGVLFGYIIPGHLANKEFKRVSARSLPKERSSV
jgi:MFS family permease